MKSKQSSLILSKKRHETLKNLELGYFAPFQWRFWRSLFVCFCVFNIIGHWLEIPYCLFMDQAFGIVSADYAVWTDPWYHPYWVYGSGAVIMSIMVEPFKEYMILRRKRLISAFFITFGFTVVLSAVMELVIGLMVNQPDQFGEYPYWDNSQLPLNIFGQAWLVNDLVIGVVAMLYVWVIYPLICEGLMKLKPVAANILMVAIIVGFTICCVISYVQIIPSW